MTESAGSVAASEGGDVTLSVSGARFTDVRFGPEEVRPGEPVELSATLAGFAEPPASVEFKVFEFVGAWPPVREIATVAATVTGDRATATWTMPADDGALLLAPVARAGEVETPGLPVWVAHGALDPPTFEPRAVRHGGQVTITVQSRGFPEGTTVEVEVHSREEDHDDHCLARLSGTTDASGQVRVQWTVPEDLEDDSTMSPRIDGGVQGEVDTPLEIQRVLRIAHANGEIDISPGPCDGALNDDTLVAIQAYRRAKNLEPPTAVIDDALRQSLLETFQRHQSEDATPDASDTVPDLFAVARAGAVSVQSDPLPVVPPCRIQLQVGDPGIFGAPWVSGLEEEAARRNEELLARKQRLQAVGYYYELLTEHPERASRKWLRGVAAFERDSQKTGDEVWPEVRERLKKQLVVPEEGEHELAGDRPIVTGKSCRVRLPGGICFANDSDLGHNDRRNPILRHRRERAFFAANPLLGRVPIVAKVQVKGRPADDGSERWVPARGLRVVFELVPAFSGELTNDLAIHEQLGIVERGTGHRARHGPRQYLSEEMPRDATATDVQRLNASESRGGKRGLPVAGNVFLTGDLGLDEERWPWRAEPGPTPSSVSVPVGPDGCATLCFAPHVAGGETYRIRAWVEGATPAGDVPAVGEEGTQEGWSRVYEPAYTGRLTIWRHLLIARYLTKGSARADAHTDVRRAGRTRGTIDLEGFVIPQLRKAFFDVEVAREGGTARAIPAAELRRAHNAAVAVLNQDRHREELGDYDFAQLLTVEPDKPYAVTFRDVAQYNANRGARAELNLLQIFFWSRLAGICSLYLDKLMFGLTENGEPGLTIVQSLAGDEPTRSTRMEKFCLRSTQYKLAANDHVAELTTKVKDLWLFKDWGNFNPGTEGSRTHVRATVKRLNGTTSTGSWERLDANATLEGYLDWLAGKISGDNPGGWFLNADDARCYLAFDAGSNPPHRPELKVEIGKADGTDAEELETWGATDTRKIWTPTTSGVAMGSRGAYLFFGEEWYRDFAYPLSANTCHELGHVLHLRHHWLDSPNDPGHHAGDHDYGDMCVMSYRSCDGDYCGRCLLHLRGWNVNAIPLNNARFR